MKVHVRIGTLVYSAQVSKLPSGTLCLRQGVPHIKMANGQLLDLGTGGALTVPYDMVECVGTLLDDVANPVACENEPLNKTAAQQKPSMEENKEDSIAQQILKEIQRGIRILEEYVRLKPPDLAGIRIMSDAAWRAAEHNQPSSVHNITLQKAQGIDK